MNESAVMSQLPHLEQQNSPDSDMYTCTLQIAQLDLPVLLNNTRE